MAIDAVFFALAGEVEQVRRPVFEHDGVWPNTVLQEPLEREPLLHRPGADDAEIEDRGRIAENIRRASPRRAANCQAR